jgi:hypothetical protein
VVGAAATVAGWVTGRALLSWRTVPGLSGAVLVTAGLAVFVHSVFRQVPGLSVAAVVAGVFLLLADRRI